MSKFVRHESSLSYNSEDLDDDEPSEYNVTPWDIETKHPDLRTIIVAKAGESLPFISKYKSSNDSNKLVRFKVDKNLNVSIEKERLKPDKLTSDGRRENNAVVVTNRCTFSYKMSILTMWISSISLLSKSTVLLTIGRTLIIV